MAVNAKAVVRSSFMLKGVGCEGELRFGIYGIVCYLFAVLAIFSFQLVKLHMIFFGICLVFRDFRREIYFAGVL